LGQDDIHEEEGSGHLTSKSEEGLGEAPPGPQEPSENLQPETGEQEEKGKLQADPGVQSRNEHLDSSEVGEDDAHKTESDVETLPKEPETPLSPGNTRSGNLDLNYGKQSLYTVAGKNCVCRSFKFSVRVKNGAEGTKIFGELFQTAQIKPALYNGDLDAIRFIPYGSQCVR
jgi:hypothetical protein